METNNRSGNFVYPRIDMVATGERIRRVSTERGLTGQDIARYLYTTPQAVSKWKTGKSLPDTENLGALLKLLEVSYEDIVIYESVKDRDGCEASLSFLYFYKYL